MQKNDVCWKDNILPVDAIKIFNIIDITMCSISIFVFVFLSIIFSEWFGFLLAIIIPLLIIALPRIGKYFRHAIKIGYSFEGLHYVTKRGKRGFIKWDDVYSIKPIMLTKEKLYSLYYNAKGGKDVLTLNKDIFEEIKPYLPKKKYQGL